MKKRIRTIFICMLLLVMLAGFGRTALSPKDINTYENRYAEKMKPLSGQTFASGDFQDSLDLALADQVQASEALKRVYNRMRSDFMRKFLPLLTGQGSTKPADVNPNNYDYVALDGTDVRLFGPEHICIMPRPLDNAAKALIDSHSANTNTVINRHPEIDFYAYYVEKDIDIDFRTGEKIPAGEYIFDKLNIPAGNTAKFVISNAASFDYYFYMTDHHWNYLGSNLAYQQLHALLSMEGPVLKPDSEVYNLGKFGGSRATGSYSQFSEDFKAYKYSFPSFLVTQNGEDFEDYGWQDRYLAGEDVAPLSYGNFYGYDTGETTFNRGSYGSNKLLVIGDSYDNALLKLLASHYDELYSVDLRYYKEYFGVDFDFDSYVAEHGITKVLLIGNREFFMADDFLLDKEVR